jgi:hypothetical protein
MAKVLRTNKDVDDVGKLLLSKAKKDYERKAKTPEGEEAQTEDGKDKLEGPKMSAKVSSFSSLDFCSAKYLATCAIGSS